MTNFDERLVDEHVERAKYAANSYRDEVTTNVLLVGILVELRELRQQLTAAALLIAPKGGDA